MIILRLHQPNKCDKELYQQSSSLPEESQSKQAVRQLLMKFRPLEIPGMMEARYIIPLIRQNDKDQQQELSGSV